MSSRNATSRPHDAAELRTIHPDSVSRPHKHEKHDVITRVPYEITSRDVLDGLPFDASASPARRILAKFDGMLRRWGFRCLPFPDSRSGRSRIRSDAPSRPPRAVEGSDLPGALEPLDGAAEALRKRDRGLPPEHLPGLRGVGVISHHIALPRRCPPDFGVLYPRRGEGVF